MSRIGAKRNFAMESQTHELETNDKVITIHEKQEAGIRTVDLTLEPDKFDQFGSQCRLTYDEYCDAINSVLEAEEKEWHELRMKDQVNLTRDALIEATIMKYAKQEYGIDPSMYTAKDLNYVKRFSNGKFLGEAVVITLMLSPFASLKIN